MATNLEVLTDALRMIGVLSETEDASAEQARDSLSAMNDMLEEWSATGIDVGQWPQTDLTETFPGPASCLHAVKSNLALGLCVQFERQPNQMLVAMASRTYSRLVRDTVRDELEPVTLDMVPGAEGDGVW